MKEDDKQTGTTVQLEKKLLRRQKSLEYLQLITKTFVSLNLTEKNAICDPLGDHVGIMSLAGLSTNRRGSLPSAFMT